MTLAITSALFFIAFGLNGLAVSFLVPALLIGIALVRKRTIWRPDPVA